MEGKRPRGRSKLRWKDTVRTDMKVWNIREEWATDRETTVKGEKTLPTQSPHTSGHP